MENVNISIESSLFGVGGRMVNTYLSIESD